MSTRSGAERADAAPKAGRDDSLTVREIDSLAALEGLRASWVSLASRVADPSPFLLPQFLLPQIRWVKDKYRLRVLSAWSRGELVGLAPLFERRVGKWGVTVRMLSFPVYGTSPPFDLLVDPSVDGVIERFVEHWGGRGDWDMIELANVRTASRTKARLERSLSRASMSLSSAHSRDGCFAPVEGSWEKYLQSRSRDLRSNYSRAWKRCQAVGETNVLRFPEDGMSLEQALSNVYSILDGSWKKPDSRGRSIRGFIDDLASELSRDGLLVLRLLMVNGRAIAYLIDIDHGRRFTAFHTAYLLEARDLWPGVIVMGDGVRHAHERGYERYDFGGEARVYITQWADSQDSYENIRLTSHRIGSRLKMPLFDAIHARRSNRARRETESRKEAAKADAAAAVSEGSRVRHSG